MDKLNVEKRKLAKASALIFIALIMAALGSCGGEETKTADQKKGPVVVASKIDTEGALLGSMIVQILEHHGFDVEDKTEFGTTDVIRKAIKAGEIDIYPEYTGNAAFFHGVAEDPVWKNPEQAWQRARELDQEADDLRWLAPSPANNTWAIAIRQDLAEQEGLESLEDFAAFIRQGGRIKLACSEEFAGREGALPSFEEAYDFHLKQSQLLILSGGNTATTEKAAAEQTDGVNAAMAYGTDGALASLSLVILEDSLNVQHVYQPAPLVRGEILDAYPEIEDHLNPVFQSLELETLQELNSRIAVFGEAASAVAGDYLQQRGFLE